MLQTNKTLRRIS